LGRPVTADPWTGGFAFPEEIIEPASFVEGAGCKITVNAYERNSEVRWRCIQEHGSVCCICGFNFGAVFGEIAEGYIHVHHLKPLAQVGERCDVDPIADLCPVCPNCHAVIHLGKMCRTIDEVRQLMLAVKAKKEGPTR
jgi:predicted HNH restriction endonuclease